MKLCTNCCWWGPNQNESSDEFGRGNCLNPRVAIPTYGEFGCVDHVSHLDTEMNVPQHTKNGTMELRNATPVDGPVEILIVTYAKDFPWLKYALQLIDKYCTGFAGITLVIPDRDKMALFDLRIDLKNVPWLIRTADEPTGVGMLNHMIQMASAEKFVPPGTRYVMHMDADCMFHTPSTPEDYFYENKPQYLYRTWESLSTVDPKDPRCKITSDCIQWNQPTSFQLGKPSEIYSMCRHPTIFPIGFYPLYRDRIAAIHGNFEQWMLSGRNSFPQDRMDFTAMGDWAWTCMRDNFYWVNCGDGNPYPKDRMKNFWSHGGTEAVRLEIESYLQ